VEASGVIWFRVAPNGKTIQRNKRSNSIRSINRRSDWIEQRSCGPQQPLRRNRRTPVSLVKPRNRLIEFPQRRIGQPPHRPQRMLRRNPRLGVDVREQRPTV
jgi:hypothetical protein